MGDPIMRHLLAFVLMIALVGSVAAADLSNVQMDTKNNDHVFMNPGTPDGRTGGETIEDAVDIGAIPYYDTGNTSDNMDDYDEVCPYTGSTSPDVVYAYTPGADVTISVDLLGSTYDTKVYVYDVDLNVVACNDDFHPGFVSFIEQADLMGGALYYIVVDGYGGAMGDFVLNVLEYIPPAPCIIDCEDTEGEPEIVDGYEDAYNGGCNYPEFGNPFQELIADGVGELSLCGQGGWFIRASDGAELRDMDWYFITMGPEGIATIELDSEFEVMCWVLEAPECDPVVDFNFTAGPCSPVVQTIQGAPGSTVGVIIASTGFAVPDGYEFQEFMYLANFTGLTGTTVATEEVTFDGIKSLYR